MIQNQMRKKNFILWYSLYATEKELEMTRISNKETLNRLLKEYAEEVDRVDKTMCLYERIAQPKTTHAQELNITLKIDSPPIRRQ
ncbi:MAG: hypothetical protein MRJ65_11380 [Candidatus Brocadiaceae bacterium]|nr:hypothetical protein [Candidatus Brocadiaceae bacterium]